VALKNTYALLATHSPSAFALPPIACGDYTHTREYGTEVKFFVRRMPRRTKHTGKYGLFYYDPGAHEQLIGVYQGKEKGWECVQSGIYQAEFDLFFNNARGGRKLVLPRCAWCGREVTLGFLLHTTGACHKNSQAALASGADPEAGVF